MTPPARSDPFSHEPVTTTIHTTMNLFKRLACILTGIVLSIGMAAAVAQSVQGVTDRAAPAAGIAPAVAPGLAAGVATRDADWFDATRQRAVPVRVYLPAASDSAAAGDPSAGNAASGTTKWPLVIFSHGLGGSRLGYSHIGQHLARNGFVALHLQHAGSDRAVWQGGPLTLLGNVRDAASEANAVARVQDVSFALTTLLADRELGRLIDTQAIAVAGHSYGANTAMLIAGASIEREGKRINYADARIKAAILLSAPPFHGEGNQAAVLRDVRLPTLHITGSDDVIRVPGYGSDVADRIGVFRDMPAARPDMKFLAIFEGGEHSVFTDRTRSERALAIKTATRDLCVAFLQGVLKGDVAAMRGALAAAQPLLIDADRLMSRRLDAQLGSN